MMRRSKLETYLDIFRVLVYLGPLKITYIMYKANVNGKVLKQHLNFLIKQNLVEERKVGKKRVEYAITQSGQTVLKCLWKLKQVLPIVEESSVRMPTQQKSKPYCEP